MVQTPVPNVKKCCWMDTSRDPSSQRQCPEKIYIYIYIYTSIYIYIYIYIHIYILYTYKVVPPSYKLVYNPINYRYITYKT